eukprot:688539_1
MAHCINKRCGRYASKCKHSTKCKSIAAKYEMFSAISRPGGPCTQSSPAAVSMCLHGMGVNTVVEPAATVFQNLRQCTVCCVNPQMPECQAMALLNSAFSS